MEIAQWYNMDECIDRTQVLNTLKSLKKEGKIDYELNGDILKIEDIDLDETEIDDLLDLFDSNDVFEEIDYSGEWDDEDDWGDNDFDEEY